MGAGLSLLILLSISVLIVRIAAVTLEHTGLEYSSARFQAMSAISGTGFTTREAEAIVNYPVRRKIVMVLMAIGNLGIVTVMSAVVVSFINTRGEPGAVLVQVFWIIGVLCLAWFFILSKRAEIWMCSLISHVLHNSTQFKKRGFNRLLQVSDGYSVCEHPVKSIWVDGESEVSQESLEELGLRVLTVQTLDGEEIHSFSSTSTLKANDKLIIYGNDASHDALSRYPKLEIDDPSGDINTNFRGH